MITKDQIDIFLKYNGDADGFARCATNPEKNIMTDKIWSLIDGLVFDLHLLNSNLASKENTKSIADKLEKYIGDESLIKSLADFASGK